MLRSLGRCASAAFFLAACPAHGQDESVWSKLLEADAAREVFTLTAHKPNYVLFTYMQTPNQAPYQFISSPTRSDNQELKFQLSIATKAADNLFGGNGDLWLSYTQVSWWQILNSAASEPFRETNYQPETYLSFLTNFDLVGLKLRTVNVGLVHQSNGRDTPLSRSWNRAFAEFRLLRGDFALSFRPWVRFKEDPNEDDNPDIENYLGKYELRAFYNWRGQVFSVMARNLFDSEHRYNSEFTWTFPIKGKARGMVQWYKGYGESMIDYNYNINRLGIGVAITDWL